MAKDFSPSSLDQIDIFALKDPEGIFELVQMVGCGSYGQVFKGVHVKTRQAAAIKVISAMNSAHEELKSELNLLKTQSHHRNIATFYGAFVKKGTPVMGDQLWLVMEYCGGGSVYDLIHSTKEKCLNEDWTALLCRGILTGLAHLHKYKIIHRDIKGQNILLTDSAEVKLVDFGVSTQLDNTLGKQSTFIGTPFWMAPEVINCEKSSDGAYDCKSDVWSLGITAIEMAEGKPPLSEMKPLQAILTIAQSEPPTVDPQRCSHTFQSFLKGCLVKDYTKRLSAQELLTHPFITGINNYFRHIRHDIEGHIRRDKEEKRLAELQAARPVEKESFPANSPPANSPPRQVVLGQQYEKQLQEYLKRKKWERELISREMKQQYKMIKEQKQQQNSSGNDDVDKQNFLNKPGQAHMHPHSPNLQRHQAVKASSPNGKPQIQPVRKSPSSPIPVPQICISPQDESGVGLRRHCPESLNSPHCYDSWNAELDQKHKRRSASHSPCRMNKQHSFQDTNGNSLRAMMRMSSSQECLRNSQQIDLNSSAPEHSLRRMMPGRERRLYSMPHGKHLGVPSHHAIPAMSYSDEKENNKRGAMYSSHNDLSSSCSEAELRQFIHNKHNISSSYRHDMSDPTGMSSKNHPIINSVKGVIRRFGLSPRGSPRHSPASSHSPSPPNVSPPSTPLDSPFNSTNDWPCRY
ncbi:TRAF2 and NCK interacting kinase a [Silurus meridionalis]|uniref:Protein kinase domain-containing protein n=1 Tax=Silurus meridionalis TaxID=175797 RepID=A0A8T0B7W8_SILME|nr:TRAF2 and NCK interacting kinase a [Silurus meridionalis]KAF7700456.1 hypothetical protein HF521_003414 [Silurus meridionalis]